MYKYICKDCGEKFDTPYEYEERHGFTHGPFEKWSVCPHCGGDYKELTYEQESDIECDGRCLNCDHFNTDDCPDRH